MTCISIKIRYPPTLTTILAASRVVIYSVTTLHGCVQNHSLLCWIVHFIYNPYLSVLNFEHSDRNSVMHTIFL